MMCVRCWMNCYFHHILMRFIRFLLFINLNSNNWKNKICFNLMWHIPQTQEIFNEISFSSLPDSISVSLSICLYRSLSRSLWFAWHSFNSNIYHNNWKIFDIESDEVLMVASLRFIDSIPCDRFDQQSTTTSDYVQ